MVLSALEKSSLTRFELLITVGMGEKALNTAVVDRRFWGAWETSAS
jgi:hypothetical protein